MQYGAVSPVSVLVARPGHSLRLREMCRFNQVDVTPVHVRNARHAYYAQIRYVNAHQAGTTRVGFRVDNNVYVLVVLRLRGPVGTCSYVDDKVGQLLAALDVAGMTEETVVIFTANHGDMLGERDLWFGMALYEMSARVPLIVSCPSRFNGRSHSRGAPDDSCFNAVR